MIIRSREHLTEDGLPTMEMLRSVLREHRIDFERLLHLRDMYNARSPILDRQRRPGQPNNRIAHPYARYITSVATGYLIGKPVTYATSEDNETMERIQEIFRRGSESAENVELARDQSIFGKGVEYVHIDDADSPMPHTTAVSPLNAFVVYSDEYDMRALFGVYYIPRLKPDGTQDGWRVWVMSETVIAQYESPSLDDLPTPKSMDRHYFGGVPLVEYWNDENEKGDFEWVLSEIEAYDKLQSDRVNDKEQTVDRILVLTGIILDTDEKGRSPKEQMREEGTLQIPDGTTAQYLTSSLDETGNQILRRDLLEDIHKLSMVPDMSDSNFASNASGVAMRYKLWGLEQLIRTKERWFTEGLRTRLRLFINFLAVKGFEALDVADVKITFTRSMPVDAQENAQNAQTARNAGLMSVYTGVSMVHAGDEWTEQDIQKETDLIMQEQSEAELGAVRMDAPETEGI